MDGYYYDTSGYVDPRTAYFKGRAVGQTVLPSATDAYDTQFIDYYNHWRQDKPYLPAYPMIPPPQVVPAQTPAQPPAYFGTVPVSGFMTIALLVLVILGGLFALGMIKYIIGS